MQIVHCPVTATSVTSLVPTTMFWMRGLYWERVCKLGSERGKSLESPEEKQKTEVQLVCREHSGGGLKPRPGATASRKAEVL